MHIKADSGKLWDYYLVLANAKSAADSECEEMKQNLEKLITQIATDTEGCRSEITGLESQVEAEQKKDEPDGQKISEWKLQIDDLSRHIHMMHGKSEEASRCLQKISSGKSRYTQAISQGRKYVSRYLSALDSVLGTQGENGGGSSDTSGKFTGDTGMFTTEFRGHAIYCDNQAFDINKKTEGQTNLQRMQDGLPPIGNDGLPINLHHMQQLDSGNFMELTQTRHKQSSKALHINSGSGIPSGVNRSAFDVFKKAYWKQRAKMFK